MLVYLLVLACAALVAWIVYRYDLYDREPWFLLLFAAAVGYVAFWGLGYLEDYSNVRLGFYGPGDGHTAGQALIAATYEELAKVLVVVLVAVLFRRHFNDPMDGLMYGAFAGLGMAVEESFFLLGVAAKMGPLDPDVDLLGRELVRIVLHVLLGGISGFGVGLVVEHTRLRFWGAILAGFLAVAMLLHFLWDYLCGIPMTAGAVTPAQELAVRATAVALMLSAMGLFAFAVVLGKAMSRERFPPEGVGPT